MTQPMGGGEIKTFTWGETLRQARCMASHLKSLDLPPGSNIAIISKNCAHFILSDLAIWMAGHASVALYPTLNADTVQYILEHSEAKLCFVGKLDEWDTMKEGVPADLPCISYPLSPPTDFDTWDDIVAKNEPLAGEPTRDPEELAIIVYTSGSTGRPKGVMHTFGSLMASTRGAVELTHSTHNDRMLSYLPLAHIFERWVVECCSLAAGFQVFFAESLDTFVQDLNRAKPTTFVSVPRLWLKFQLGVLKKMPQQKLDRMLKIPILNSVVKKKILAGLGLDSVRMAGSGSAPIPGELIEWYRKLGLELLEGYGMSERLRLLARDAGRAQVRVGYVGRAYDCASRLQALSEEGEILVKSARQR